MKSQENLGCANFLIPNGLEIIIEGKYFSEENGCWMPTYKIVFKDGIKSGGLKSLMEAVIMARGEWAEYCESEDCQL